jgi:hypothetical protein
VRLDPLLRWTTYLVFALLFLSGGTWFAADRLKDALAGDLWQEVAVNALMVHGGTAMLALIIIGALLPLHALRAWRARLNRVTGIAMGMSNAVLMLTAFGLYYLGSESLQPWASLIHLIFGFALPVLLLVHIIIGRRKARLRLQALAPQSPRPAN